MCVREPEGVLGQCLRLLPGPDDMEMCFVAFLLPFNLALCCGCEYTEEGAAVLFSDYGVVFPLSADERGMRR